MTSPDHGNQVILITSSFNGAPREVIMCTFARRDRISPEMSLVQYVDVRGILCPKFVNEENHPVKEGRCSECQASVFNVMHRIQILSVTWESWIFIEIWARTGQQRTLN
jgi:hypothetical protein